MPDSSRQSWIDCKCADGPCGSRCEVAGIPHERLISADAVALLEARADDLPASDIYKAAGLPLRRAQEAVRECVNAGLIRVEGDLG